MDVDTAAAQKLAQELRKLRARRRARALRRRSLKRKTSVRVFFHSEVMGGD
jgi:hypothetical protein